MSEVGLTGIDDFDRLGNRQRTLPCLVHILEKLYPLPGVILAPLLVFSRKLEEVSRTGVSEYGILAQRYARQFDQKWLRGGASADEALLGSSDVQSLADMGSSFDAVNKMRWTPFTVRDVLQLSKIMLLPMLPLTLAMFSLPQLLEGLLKLVF